MIVSSIEGRVRFKDENIKDRETVKNIKKSLKELDGIESIRVNDIIGSLLIKYDSGKINIIDIVEQLREYIDTSKDTSREDSSRNNGINEKIERFKDGLKIKRYT